MLSKQSHRFKYGTFLRMLQYIWYTNKSKYIFRNNIRNKHGWLLFSLSNKVTWNICKGFLHFKTEVRRAAASCSNPASVEKFVRQVDVGEEVRMYGSQGLNLSLDLTLLHQFQLQQEQTNSCKEHVRGSWFNTGIIRFNSHDETYRVLTLSDLRVHTHSSAVSHMNDASANVTCIYCTQLL